MGYDLMRDWKKCGQCSPGQTHSRGKAVCVFYEVSGLLSGPIGPKRLKAPAPRALASGWREGHVRFISRDALM